MSGLITFGLQVVIAAVYFTIGHYIGWYKGFWKATSIVRDELKS
jgi:hypothetical protein